MSVPALVKVRRRPLKAIPSTCSSILYQEQTLKSAWAYLATLLGAGVDKCLVNQDAWEMPRDGPISGNWGGQGGLGGLGSQVSVNGSCV